MRAIPGYRSAGVVALLVAVLVGAHPAFAGPASAEPEKSPRLFAADATLAMLGTWS